jgi:hypothetical protein
MVKKAAGNFVCDLPDAFTVATPAGEEVGRLKACHGFILESQLTTRRSLLTSRLLFLAEFLKARIIPERIEHRIEPEKGRSERAPRERAGVRDRE